MQKIKIETGLLSGKEFFKEELKSGSSCFTNPDNSVQFDVSGVQKSKVVSIIQVEKGLLSGQMFKRTDLEIDEFQLDCFGDSAAFTKGFSFGFKS